MFHRFLKPNVGHCCLSPHPLELPHGGGDDIVPLVLTVLGDKVLHNPGHILLELHELCVVPSLLVLGVNVGGKDLVEGGPSHSHPVVLPDGDVISPLPTVGLAQSEHSKPGTSAHFLVLSGYAEGALEQMGLVDWGMKLDLVLVGLVRMGPGDLLGFLGYLSAGISKELLARSGHLWSTILDAKELVRLDGPLMISLASSTLLIPCQKLLSSWQDKYSPTKLI